MRCYRPFRAASATRARRFGVAALRANSTKATSINRDEMAHFNQLASSWWDVNGPQRILHKMNLLRMDFIHSTITSHLKLNSPDSPDDDVYIPPYSVDLLPRDVRTRVLQEQEERRTELLSQNKLSVLDVGCGGGILSESMARLYFVDNVTGIDLSPDVVEAAKLHRAKDPILEKSNKLDYQLVALEDLDVEKKYDIVTMFEMLEHVDYPSQVLTEGLERVRPGGWLFLSTINRDFVSWFTTIFMGEHLLRIVPVGTHTLGKYINQKEIAEWLKQDGERSHQYKVVDARGCVYLPACGWKFTDSPNIGNYFMAIQRVK